jgi:hypothetical protein
MRLKLMALSDTHVGEDTSILSFPHGRQTLWAALRRAFGEPDPTDPGKTKAFWVDEMILMGDIADRTLSSTSEIITHANALVDTLGSAAMVGKAVYVPGNHDHTIWTDYARPRFGKDSAITPPGGEPLVQAGAPVSAQGAVRSLLELFFGFPGGSSWRATQDHQRPDLYIANPLYATQACGRTYVFTHGTLFRTFDVAAGQLRRRTIAYLAKEGLKARVRPGRNVRKAKDLEDMEARAQPLVDTLWPSAANDPTPAGDRWWSIWVALSGRYGRKRPTFPEPLVCTWAELPASPTDRIARLTPGGGKPDHASVPVWQQHFLPHMAKHLADHGLPTSPLTFVYGDTHTGGFGEVAGPDGHPIRLLNTGAWTVDNGQDHPPCQVFALGEDGRERLLDVTLSGVTVSGRPLLELAGESAEHRHHREGTFVKWVTSVIGVLKDA